MNRKWCLLKASDGVRGEAGKKKVYEVTVSDNTLVCEWGMAERPSRQRSTQHFMYNQSAMAAAYEKVSSKINRGYELVYSV